MPGALPVERRGRALRRLRRLGRFTVQRLEEGELETGEWGLEDWNVGILEWWVRKANY
jgi:hypothetical protein